MKMCFFGGSSGTIMSFPFGVGNWKSGEEKEIENEIGKKLTDAFPLLKEVGLCKKELNEKVIENPINVEPIENAIPTIKNYRSLSHNELVAECVNRNIDPPDNANKSQLKQILLKFDKEKINILKERA